MKVQIRIIFSKHKRDSYGKKERFVWRKNERFVWRKKERSVWLICEAKENIRSRY